MAWRSPPRGASKESNVRATGRHEDCAGFSFATALAGAPTCAFASAVAAVTATAFAAALPIALAAAVGVALARLPHLGTY
jgi:hypothetical protein